MLCQSLAIALKCHPTKQGCPPRFLTSGAIDPTNPGILAFLTTSPIGKPDNVLSGVGVLPFADDDDLPVFSDDYSGIDVAAIGDDPTEGPTRF